MVCHKPIVILSTSNNGSEEMNDLKLLQANHATAVIDVDVEQAQAMMCGFLTQECFDLGGCTGAKRDQRFVAIRYIEHIYNHHNNKIEPVFLCYSKLRFVGSFFCTALEDIVSA
jgi:hypothetical protein